MSRVVWITGLSGAGKTTLAEALVEAAGQEPLRATSPRAMGLAEIARLARGSVWRLECKA